MNLTPNELLPEAAFMLGAFIMFIAMMIVILIIRNEHKREMEFQRGIRKIEIEAIEEFWKNEMDDLKIKLGSRVEYYRGEKVE